MCYDATDLPSGSFHPRRVVCKSRRASTVPGAVTQVGSELLGGGNQGRAGCDLQETELSWAQGHVGVGKGTQGPC